MKKEAFLLLCPLAACVKGFWDRKRHGFFLPSPYLSRPKWPMKKVAWGVAIKHLKWAPVEWTGTGFIRGILRGVRYAKSLRVLFLHRRSPSWTTLVLYSRAVFIFNEPTRGLVIGSRLKWRHLHLLYFSHFLPRNNCILVAFCRQQCFIKCTIKYRV